MVKTRSIFGVAALIFLLDQFSKWLTHAYIPPMDIWSMSYPYNGTGIFQLGSFLELSISYAKNRGMAWGLLADYQWPLVYLRLLFLIGLSIAVWNKQFPQSWSYALGLLIGGGFGNVVDAFFYGHVIDMVHFVIFSYDFPVFNVADIAIFFGVVWIGALTFLRNDPEELELSKEKELAKKQELCKKTP